MIDPTLVLHLFGTAGQDRFSFLGGDPVEGVLGSIALVALMDEVLARHMADGAPSKSRAMAR